MSRRLDVYRGDARAMSDTTQALDAVRERRRMLDSRGGYYEASGKLWLREIQRQKEVMKRHHEEARQRNAKLKEDAAAAAELYDAMRNDSAMRLHKTEAEAAKKQYLDHIHSLYPQWCREVESAATEHNRRLGASILDAQKRRLLAAERFATQMTMRTEMAAREQELLESAAQGMKEHGQRTKQLQQAQQQADLAATGDTAAAAAAAAVLNALVEGAQHRGPVTKTPGDDNLPGGAGDLQQGINRLVALLEGAAAHQAPRPSDSWDMPPDSPPKRFEPPSAPYFAGHRWGVQGNAGGNPSPTNPTHPHAGARASGSSGTSSLKGSYETSVKESVESGSRVSVSGGLEGGSKVVIQADAALDHSKSPGRYDFSSPDGTPVASLDLGAAAAVGALPRSASTASRLGAEDPPTPASSVGLGARVVPLGRTVSGMSSASAADPGPKSAPAVAPIGERASMEIDTIRLSRTKSLRPALAQAQAKAKAQLSAVLSDTDSDADEEQIAAAPDPVYSWSDESRRSKNSIPLSSMRPQPEAAKQAAKPAGHERSQSGSSLDNAMQFLGHSKRRTTVESSVSIHGEVSLLTGLGGGDKSPDTSFDSDAGGGVRSSGGQSAGRSRLEFATGKQLGDSIMSDLTEDSALSFEDEDVAAQREAWNRELELRQAAIAQEKAAEAMRRQKADLPVEKAPSSPGSSQGPPSPAARGGRPLGSFGISASLGGSSTRLSNIMSKAFDDSLGGSDGDSSEAGLGETISSVAASQGAGLQGLAGSARQAALADTSDEFDF